MTTGEAEKIEAAFFEKLEKAVLKKYHHYIGTSVQNITCKKLDGKTVGSVNKPVCRISLRAMHSAYLETKKDIRFLMERRGKLVERLKLSFGKIAGVLAYRLAKANIINLCDGCASCDEQPCDTPKLNQILALRCAVEYIGIKYFRIPEDIRKELLYSFSCRHVNQETLGLVFDTILATCEKKQSTP